MNMRYAMRSEDTEQINVVSWANWNVNRYPELKWLHHVPNGGSRNKQEAVKLKQMGVKAGVSDLCLPYPTGLYCGLYIEMKFGDNRQQETQKEFLADMAAAGHFVATCYSAEEAVNKRITGGTEKMRIIAVMSPKGGIGKTTTSDAIAYMLGEEQEKRVLILDGDPQGDTSKTFEAYEPEGTGMSELLERHVSVGGSYRTTDLIRPTQYSHIDIIPANGYLLQTDMKLLLKQEANQVTRLRDALEEISEAYDYCICDCGRLLDMVVINILLAAELVIAPVKVGGYENEAIHNLQEQVDDLREINPELRIKGLVTMRQKNKTSLDFEEWMKTSSGFDMFVTPIRRSIVAEKASMRMAVLPQFSKNCIVSQDYRNVVHELLKEMEG